MESPVSGLKDIAEKFFGSFGGEEPKSSRAGKDVWSYVKEAINLTADNREYIQKLRDFFNGDQITGTGLNAGDYYIPSWPDEDDDDKETRAERMEALAWNRIRDGVLTHADALYASGKGHSIRRDIMWDGEGSKDQVESFFRKRVWEKNDMTMFMWDAWAKAGAERYAIVMPLWRDGRKRRLNSFSEGTPRQIHRESGVVWYEILDNLNCLPLPDPYCPRELGALIRWYRDPTDSNPLMPTGQVEPGMKGTITELITDNLWLRWRGTELYPHKWNTSNRYGDVRDLATWIRNPADIADSEDAIPGQILLLEHIYNSTEIHRGHAFPETLYRGYDPPHRETSDGRKILARGPSIAHQADDPQADIIKRGPPADLKDVGIAEGTIHEMLDEALAVSGMERGSGSQLGQLRSGPGISKLMAKSERRRSRKILWAIKAERDLFNSTLRMFAYHGFPEKEREQFDGCSLDLHFPEDSFSSDTYTEAQREALEVQTGTETLEQAIREKHPEASESEISELVSNAKKEVKERQAKPPSTDPSAADRAKAQE